MPVRPEEVVFQFLADDTGERNAVGNYSEPTEFYYEATKAVYIHRMIVQIVEGPGKKQNRYGPRRALSNGYTVIIKDKSGKVVNDLCDGVPIYAHDDLKRYCYDVTATGESVTARWTFAKSGEAVYLPVDYRLSITLNDNFSRLDGHYFMLQGFED